jgi:small Trp-rich protein
MKQQGIGFFGILGLIFITLKVLAIQPVADWSWWLVLLPIYGGLVFVLAVAFFIFLVYTLIGLGEKARRNSRRF